MHYPNGGLANVEQFGTRIAFLFVTTPKSQLSLSVSTLPSHLFRAPKPKESCPRFVGLCSNLFQSIFKLHNPITASYNFIWRPRSSVTHSIKQLVGSFNRPRRSASVLTAMEPHLPPEVEQLLESIRSRHGLPHVGVDSRQRLASLGQDAALRLLHKIAAAGSVRSLDGFIRWLAGDAAAVRSSPTRQSFCAGINAANGISEIVLGLAELEFRKAFLILSYVGRKTVEDVVPIEYIRGIRNLPMIEFEKCVWNKIGQMCIDPADRRKEVDWDDRRTHIYRCYIGQDEEVTFKGPFLQTPETLLQRVFGDDMILDVRFAEAVNKASRSSYLGFLKDGITVGWRKYRFFVYKDGGKEEKRKSPSSSSVKCYFVCNETYVSQNEECSFSSLNKSISELRLLFMHIHTVSISKYNPRLSLILSKTMKLGIDLSTVNFEIIDDVPCRDKNGKVIGNEDDDPPIHTDGTGYISEDLALLCPNNIYKGKFSSQHSLKKKMLTKSFEEISKSKSFNPLSERPPLLIQFRMFYDGYAVKGTVLINKKLPSRTIQVRRSMVKVFRDPNISLSNSVNSFEIVGTSNHPKHANLSRYIIAHLCYGGVPKEYFTSLVESALSLSQSNRFNKRTALQVALRRGDMDNNLISRMILSGIPIEEPFLQERLSVYMNEERKGLLSGKIPMWDCYYLMGTADPTGTLKPNQVCIILENGPISGKVLVYKHPGLHFGDVHVVEAIYVPKIVDTVGSSKYAIFFPITGSRSLADEIANSDFDGDIYWVSMNPQFVDTFRASDPWKRPPSKRKVQQPKALELSEEDLEHKLHSGFLKRRFESCNVIGGAADSWLVYMDRLLTLGSECADEKNCIKEKMLQLVNIYYDALDAEKLGTEVHLPSELKPEKYPHFMERQSGYKSTSILGQIYDMVKLYEPDEISKDVLLLAPFSIEVPEVCLKMWEERYKQYRKEMQFALSGSNGDKNAQNIAANEVIQACKELLYGAAEFEQCTRAMQDVFNEALAIYQVTYNYAKSIRNSARCRFAWKVAGHALCKFYAMKSGEEGLYCSPSVLKELFT